MKRVFKRWMAMLLAVLMVMGTLPTTAWAARIEDDATPATPVVDGKDGVVDTLAKSGKDDDVTPINPVDPDPQPGDLSDAEVNSVSVVNDGTTIFTAEIARQDPVTVLFLPDFAFDSSSLTPAGSFTNGGNGGMIGEADHTKFAAAGPTLKSYVGVDLDDDGNPDLELPYTYYMVADAAYSDGSGIYGTLTMTADGTFSYENATKTKSGSLTATSHSTGKTISELFSFDFASLLGGKTIYQNGVEVDTTKGYPYKVFIIPTGTVNSASINISPVKLTVNIVTKDAVMKTGFSYTQPGKSTGARMNGEQLFTEVTLTNNTDEDMVVNVLIEREQITSIEKDNYGSNSSISGNPSVTIVNALKDASEGCTALSAAGGAFTLDKLYGLLGNEESGNNRKWDGSLNANGVVEPLQNATTQTTLSAITIPANNSTTVYVAGTQGTLATTQMKNGLNGFQKPAGTPWTNFWSSYKITATSTTDNSVTAYDTAGIRWVDSPSTWPKVRLIHGTDKNAIIAPEDDTGNIINGQDSLAPDSTSTKGHTVMVKDKDADLTWNEDEQYWELPTDRQELGVGINKSIEVDGVRVGATLADADEIIYVSMGTVTIEDDPPGATGTTKDHYMWDTTAAADIDYKKVSYTYYPYGATVGVYAKKEGFIGEGGWTGAGLLGATDGTNVLKAPDNTRLEANAGGTLTKVAAAQVKISGDMTVTAHYVKPVTLVTTYNGKEPGDNTPSNQGDRNSDHVFTIVVRDTSGNTAASWTSSGAATKITEQGPTNAWEIDLDAGTYRLYINNRPIGANFTTSKLPVVEGTTYNFVVELVGVTPIVKGSTSAADTLALPGDNNPARSPAPGNVTVSGAAPNTDEAIVLYYPTVSSATVNGGLDSGSKILKLTYPEDTDANAKEVTNNADSTWKLTATNMTFTKSGTNRLTATFGATSGAAIVDVKLDTGVYTGLTVELVDGNGDVQASLPETSTNGTYSNSAVAPGTYSIKVTKDSKSVTTGTVEVVAGKNDPDAVTVQFYTASVAVSPKDKGTATMTVADAYADKIIAGNKVTTTTSDVLQNVVVLKGAAITWVADDNVTHWQWKDWGTYGATKTISVDSISAAAPRTANFEQKNYKVTFKPNGGANLGGTNEDKVVSVKAESSIGATAGASMPTATRAGYTFDKWTTNQDGTGTTFTSATKVTDDIAVYAQWTYTISYDLNSAKVTVGSVTSSKPGDQSGVGGDGGKTAAAAATATYFDFDGWNTKADGTGTDYADGAAVPEGTKTLYAQWTRKTAEITVQFKVNGGNANPGGTQTVKLDGGNATMLGTSDTTVKYTVDQGSAYTITLDGTSFTYDTETITGAKTVPINFYSLTVTADHTTDSGSKVGQSTTSPATADQDSDGPTNYLVGTKVYINAKPSTSLYQFGEWTVVDSKGDKPTSTDGTATITMDKETNLKATFTKPYYNTQLDVLVNGVAKEALDAAGGDVTGISLTVGSNTYSVANGKVSYKDGHWIAENVTAVAGDLGTWTVTTLSGGYEVDGKGDMDALTGYTIPEMKLYSVEVATGTYGNTTKAPTITTNTQATPGPRAIGKAGQSFTLNCQKDDGYTIASPYWTETVENQSKGTTTATSYTLKDAPDGKMVDADGEGQTLTPVYTYEVTVRTVRGTTPTAPGGTVVVNGNTISPTSAGVYKVTGLIPGDTKYPITVNGFKSSKEIKVTDADHTVDVKLYSVSVTMQTAVTGETIDGKVAIVIGDTTPTAATPVYLPEGAETDATHKVTVKATTGTNYRLKTATGEHPWTAATYVNDQDATTTTVKTPSGGMADDITITADFVRQWTVNSYISTAGATSTAKLEGGTGDGGVGAAKQSTKILDNGQTVKITFAPGLGEDLSGWTFATGTAGKWCATDSSTDSDWKDISVAANRPDNTVTEFYFKPTATSTITAAVEARKYQVEVTVKLDNVKYTGRTVQLKKYSAGGTVLDGTATPITLNEVKESDNVTLTGRYASGAKEVLPGKYQIWVDGVTTGSVVYTNEDKDIEFTAGNAEGKNPTTGADLSDADKAAGLARLKQELNYYTVKLAASPVNSGSVNNQVDFASTVNGITSSATGTASTIVLARAGTTTRPINVAAKAYDDGDKTHYRYDNWSTKVGTFNGGTTTSGVNSVTGAGTAAAVYNLPGENNLKWAGATAADGEINGSTNQITLTATFVQQYKVTVQSGTRETSSITPQVMVTGDTAASPWKTTVYVDAGGTVSLQTKGTLAGRHFQSFTIADDGATPTATLLGKGKFQNDTDTTQYDQEKGLRKQDPTNATVNPNNLNVFKPEEDTVINLNLWLEPQLSDGGWTYERGVGKENNGTGVKKFTWLNNDAKEITKVTVQGTNSGNSYTATLTKDTDYELTGGKIVLKDEYIDSASVTKGDYKITVEYTLGTTDNEVEKLTTTALFYITQTPYTLTKVDIGVATKTATTDYTRAPDKTLTMNIHATDDKTNQVAYLEKTTGTDLSHLPAEISKSDLTFTWYWSATSPGADSRPLTAAEITNLNKATPTYPGGATWNELSSDMTATFTSDGAGGYTAVPTFTSNATNYTNLQGKYVFAVVTAATTGTGSVITNPISVDYDATVIVKQDGNPVTDAKTGEYAVYLWPTDGGTFDVTSSKAIQATHTAADGTNNGKYTTKNSALNAFKSYHIYVLETEGMDKATTANYVQLKNGTNAVVYTRATTTAPQVDYYTVKVTDMSATSDIKHLEDLKSDVVTAGSAQETFTSYPTFTATTGKGVKITSANTTGKGVLKGTAVTATANETSTGSKIGWTQDYTLAWQDKEGAETAFSDAASKLKQSSSDAVSTGYPYTKGLANKVDITGRLEQNYYTIEGNVVDINRQSGAITSGGGAIKSPKLTAGTTTYAGSMDNQSPKGGHGTTVSFTVPRALANTYTLTAEPTDGTSGTPNTTMKGYKVPSNTTAPPTVDTSINLGAVDAGSTGDALKNRFTIFVAATNLTLSVSDGHDGHGATSSRTDGTSLPNPAPGNSKHTVTVIYDNYATDPERNQNITITNGGNTPLNVKLMIEKKKAADSSWTTVYKDNGTGTVTGTLTDVASSTKKKDTNGVTFDALALEYTLDLADAKKSATIPVEIPDNLKVADSVTYRFTFNSADGRDGVTGQGPILTFDLIITVNPVTIGRVTAENDKGTFKVQHHWLQEDVTRDGGATTKAQIDARYAADTPSEHYWAAETITTAGSTHPAGRTSMASLTKQTGTAAAADDDIYYRWYVADPDAVVTWDNKTIGTLKCTNGKQLTQVSTATSYTPGTNDHGKNLYLVAVGKNNATNAVMTPDKDEFDEDPVPIPYPATITLHEISTAADKLVAAKEKDNYEVWLWDVTPETGSTPLTDKLDKTNKDRAFEAEPSTPDADDGKYVTGVYLYPGHTYQVWTSVAKNDGTNTYEPRNTGITISGVNQKEKAVNYYLVDVADTTVNQNDYDTALKNKIPDDSLYFYNDNDLTAANKLDAPTATIPGKNTGDAARSVKDNYVLNDTTVTFGFGDRALDYDLIWGGGMTDTTDKPSDKNVSHPLTYKDAPKAAVTTQLKLNLYDVNAWVVGQGVVSRVTMTMTDGANKYTFVTDTTGYTAAAGETVLLGMKNATAQATIGTGSSAPFRLPKYEGTAGAAGYETIASHDAAYTLSGYYATHGDSSTLHNPEPTAGTYDPFYKGVTKNDAYDIVLQGDSFDMRVTDNVPTDTKKDTSGATSKYADGLYDPSKGEGETKNTDGTVNQIIKLNYNYAAPQNIKLTVTNETKQPESDSDPLNYIYDVTFAQKKAEGGIAVNGTATNDFSGGSVDQMGRKTVDIKTLTLTIPANLPVGSYDYQAEFTYLSEDGVENTGAKVTYNLTVIVEPLTFTKVEITPETQADGTTKTGKLTIKDYDAERKAEGAETSAHTFSDVIPNANAANPDPDTALKQNPDYAYQWISAPVSMSESDVKAAVSWSNGVLSVDEATTDVAKCTGTGSTGKTYTPNDDDAGRNIFLVIYGKDDATATNNTDRRNATGFAVSNVEKNTYKGIVTLKVDGVPKKGKDDADSAIATKTNDGDGYEVVFVNEDNTSKTVPAKWTTVGTEYAYVADLEPNTKGYSVKISRARDNATQEPLTGALITGDALAPANTINTTYSNVVEAEFYTVNAVAFTARPYKTTPTDTGEKFTLAGGGTSTTQTNIQPTFKLGNDPLESGTPVLKDQEITAAVSETTTGSGKGWTQDYTLTWQDKLNDSTFDTSAAKADDKTTATATTAVSNGYDHGAVIGKTYIGGRLDQNTYTIEGTISGGSVLDQQVKNVTLQETTSNILYYSDDDTTTNNEGIKSAVWDDTGNNDGFHNSTDKVIFTVVKGSYTITGYEDGNYTIRKVTVDGAEPAAGTKRNQNTVANVVNSSRKFVIHLEPTGDKLGVKDDQAGATYTVSSPKESKDHQHADNEKKYFFNNIATLDHDFELKLNNPGNVDLTLKDAPEVWWLPSGTDYTSIDQAFLTANGTKLTVAANGALSAGGTPYTAVTVTGLPAPTAENPVTVPIGAGKTGSGVDAEDGGVVTVNTAAVNKDDGIYVVKFTSKYTTTDGSPAGDHDGPTVYYVLDLTVEPLPIKEVAAEPLNDGTGTLRLTNNALNSVLVDHDGDGKTAATGGTDPIGAQTAGLKKNDDISFLWFSAPADMDADDVKAALDWNAGETGIVSSNTSVKVGVNTNTNTDTTYIPADEEQGLNFYLVAYRTNANSNASEFAVSVALYAEVTISLETRRTGGDKTDDKDLISSGKVQIKSTVGETEYTSNTAKDGKDPIIVIDAGIELTFTADETADKTAPINEPANAEYYFVRWGVNPEDAATVPTERSLTWVYPVTKKSTVIGYYDLLPKLTYTNNAVAGGYVIGNDIDEVRNDRTLKYDHNDGSGTGKVRIFIKPADDGTSDFNGTWAGQAEQELGFSHFDSVSGKTGSSIQFGEDGEYLLSREYLIKPYLKSGSTYVITFYDMEKGSKAEKYEGYDRSVTLKITAGNFDVTARAKDVDGDDTNGNQGGNVRLYTETPADDSGFKKTDTKTTSGGFIQAEAKPEPGYRFVEWKVLTKDDDDAVANGGDMTPKDGKSFVVSFSPEGEGAILEASFEKAPFTPQNDAKTSVYYGDDVLQATDGKLEVSVVKDTTNGVTQTFSYDLATEEELTDYLNGAARPANVYTKDGVEVVPGDPDKNTNVAPKWLKLTQEDNTTASFSVETGKAATGVNVQKKTDASGNLVDVDNELVVYLKVTETNTGEYKLVPVTIDVMTSKLKIVTPKTPDSTEQTDAQKTDEGVAYKTLFNAGEGAIPDHDDKVYYDYFAYTDVQNYYNANDKVDEDNHAAHAAGANPWDKTAGATNTGYGKVTNGYWTVDPKIFDGTGENEYQANQDITNTHDYEFTFHYTGADTAEDDYNYEDTTIILTIPAKVPEMSLKFSDTLTTTTDGGDPKALLTLTKGEHSTETGDDGYTKGGAPITLAQSTTVYRTDEHLTYLDEEPVFYVTLHKVGSLAKVELIPTGVDGFEVDPDKLEFPIDNTQTTQTLEFPVKLSELEDGLWKGTHTITITAKGYPDANEPGRFIEATYQLEIKMDPKIITSLDVTVTEAKDKPDEVKGKLDGDPDDKDPTDLTKPDAKVNTPVKETTVTWGPDDGPDDKKTEVKVKVEIDPNYKYVEGDDTTDPPTKDITETTDLTVTGHLTPDPTVERVAEDEDHIVLITQKIPYLMHDDVNVDNPADKTGPMKQYSKDTRLVTVLQNATGLGSYTINLGAYGSDVYDVEWTIEADEKHLVGEGGIGAVLKDSEGNDLTWNEVAGTIATAGPKASFVLDLSAVDTSQSGYYSLTLKAAGKANDKEDEERTILSTYIFRLYIRPNNPPSPAPDPCPCKVFYHIGSHGTTTNPTVEDVSESSRPSKVPTVTAVDGYTFRGWSLTNPATLKKGEQPVLVDPRTVQAKGDTMIFYAVIQKTPFHEHYVIGYPDGTFGPGDDINRASVATIIARAILPDFVEGANYGNPGGYSDVSGHWAESAIAYCSKFGVFEGMPDGTFQPNRAISRQEFALVMARLDGVMKAGEMNVTDVDDIASWALDGVYTTYVRGWVNGYPDGSFKPLNNIRRDEAVKVFNAYLKRGVDADGLRDLHEYVYPDKNTGNDFDKYRIWPDVPANHWAYYEIIEAANDHAYEAEMDGTYKMPEKWTQCWINERWGLSIADADAAMVSAGFQVWFH